MRKLLLLFILAPLVVFCHPGIAIVKDSKGNIYYSDLFKIYKISKGKTTVILPDIHTHELYVDAEDNLIGEDLHYDGTSKFYHTLWRLNPSGKLDTLVNRKEAFISVDYAIARDNKDNEYYIKAFSTNSDTTHIYKRSVDGKETLLATGNFKGVTWLHPQDDGSILYVHHNNVYRLTSDGNTHLIAKKIGNEKPSFPFSGNSITVWGAWQDAAENVYVAVFSDQTVKKISPSGKVSDYYKSDGNWAPNHGVFDNNGQLWLLESNDKNEIRAIQANPQQNASERQRSPVWIIIAITAGIIFLAVSKKRRA
jgi:hypothetical protein